MAVVDGRAAEGGGTEPCTDLHAAVQRPGRTQGPLVYSSVANNVTAEETLLAASGSALHQQRAPRVSVQRLFALSLSASVALFKLLHLEKGFNFPQSALWRYSEVIIAQLGTCQADDKGGCRVLVLVKVWPRGFCFSDSFPRLVKQR